MDKVIPSSISHGPRDYGFAMFPEQYIFLSRQKAGLASWKIRFWRYFCVPWVSACGYGPEEPSSLLALTWRKKCTNRESSSTWFHHGPTLEDPASSLFPILHHFSLTTSSLPPEITLQHAVFIRDSTIWARSEQIVPRSTVANLN